MCYEARTGDTTGSAHFRLFKPPNASRERWASRPRWISAPCQPLTHLGSSVVPGLSSMQGVRPPGFSLWSATSPPCNHLYAPLRGPFQLPPCGSMSWFLQLCLDGICSKQPQAALSQDKHRRDEARRGCGPCPYHSSALLGGSKGPVPTVPRPGGAAGMLPVRGWPPPGSGLPLLEASLHYSALSALLFSSLGEREMRRTRALGSPCFLALC